ncbi:hypothetical protein TFLX_05579 [Thermoflexales bacterium]|nr:hypothetical protein TFLX_05579 [Thermoflexales bacterium]
MQSHFRANPGYEIVLFDRLPETYRAQLASLQTDPDCYGVLWPRVPGLVAKAVDRETALLFFTMQQPGPIPTYVRSSFGERCNQVIAELVLDGVLEIAQEPDGEFVTGAVAHPLIFEARTPASAGGRVARLSLDAIEYGQALAIESSAELSARLYTYNMIPASPAWHKLIPTSDAVLGFLRIDAEGRNRRVLDRWYTHQSSNQNGTGWRIWHLRRGLEPHRETWRPAYKLYISPRPETLPEILDAIVGELGAAKVASFKIGQDLFGLLRPDKVVAYCAEFDELATLAARLQKTLAGCPAQGVPFTAGIDPAGLLSWGTDPPREIQEFAGLEQESWRLWVTNHLAVALLASKAQSAAIRPCKFALERLRLDGVDTETWTPRQAIWQSERRG